MSSFWERQRAKQQPAAPVNNSAPWWARGSDILAQRQTVPQNPAQSQTELSQQDSSKVNGHDVSRIGLLKGGAEECPICPPDPKTGIRGNMYRISRNYVLRCLDCGYKEDNRFLGETEGLMAVTEGSPQKARQTNSGGAVVNNYHGNIKTAAQAAGRLS